MSEGDARGVDEAALCALEGVLAEAAEAAGAPRRTAAEGQTIGEAMRDAALLGRLLDPARAVCASLWGALAALDGTVMLWELTRDTAPLTVRSADLGVVGALCIVLRGYGGARRRVGVSCLEASHDLLGLGSEADPAWAMDTFGKNAVDLLTWALSERRDELVRTARSALRGRPEDRLAAERAVGPGARRLERLREHIDREVPKDPEALDRTAWDLAGVWAGMPR